MKMNIKMLAMICALAVALPVSAQVTTQNQTARMTILTEGETSSIPTEQATLVNNTVTFEYFRAGITEESKNTFETFSDVVPFALMVRDDVNRYAHGVIEGEWSTTVKEGLQMVKLDTYKKNEKVGMLGVAYYEIEGALDDTVKGWGLECLKKLSDKGYLNTAFDSNTSFKDTVKVEDAVEILSRAFTLNKDYSMASSRGYIESKLKYVNRGDEYFYHVANLLSKMNKEDVVKHVESLVYGRSSEMSRGQFASLLTALCKADGRPANLMLVHYSDTDNPDITMCANFGLMNGYEDGSFKPEKPINYGEFSSVMLKYFN